MYLISTLSLHIAVMTSRAYLAAKKTGQHIGYHCRGGCQQDEMQAAPMGPAPQQDADIEAAPLNGELLQGPAAPRAVPVEQQHEALEHDQPLVYHELNVAAEDPQQQLLQHQVDDAGAAADVVMSFPHSGLTT